MKIAIDMQGAQADSRYRGLGKYTGAFARAMVDLTEGKGIYLALNEAFPDALESLLAEYKFLPAGQLLRWRPISPLTGHEPENTANRLQSEDIYENCLLSCEPAAVIIPSMFESYGYCNEAVTAVNRMRSKTIVASVLHDLIPLINPDIYLCDPNIRKWYYDKLEYVTRSDIVLAISNSARNEGLQYLDLAPERVIAISSAVPESFRPTRIADKEEILFAFGITKPFLLHTAGREERKNVRGLIQAYAQLPSDIQRSHQLVVVFDITDAIKEDLLAWAASCGLSKEMLVLTGFVADDVLFKLYNLCKLFVFPSFHEGFGLPLLEAMSCGRPCIASNTSSMPEVLGREDALFNPYDAQSIAACITRVLTDGNFYAELSAHALRQSASFSWSGSAQRVLETVTTFLPGVSKGASCH